MSAETVLLVEDEPDLLAFLEFTFEKAGYETIAFDEGTAAWTYLEENTPDCMVLDLLMPGIDGMEILHRRSESDRISGIPVLVLTGSDSETSVMKAFDRGADEYLTKPFSPEELLVRTRRLLR